MINVTYMDKDCFGHYVERSDTCYGEGEAEIRKAFRELENDPQNAVKDDIRCLWWDSINDWADKIVTERVFTSPNSFDDRRERMAVVRREWIDRRNNQEA